MSEPWNERAIFLLIRAFNDASPYVRRVAVDALGKTRSSKVVRLLFEALTDEDRYVRETSAEALGHLGKMAIPTLIQGISNPDWRIRVDGVIALRVSPSNHNSDPVILALSDALYYVRREAVKTLGRIGDKRILPYLVEATNDPDAGVRLRAVRAVVKIGSGEEVAAVLRRCIQEPNSAVRLRAGEELQRMYEGKCQQIPWKVHQ